MPLMQIVIGLMLVGERQVHPAFSQRGLLQVVIALVVVGVLLWLVNSFIPMAGSIKSILNAVVVIVVVVWLLNIFGILHYISTMHIGRTG
jgi:hypothetical protein